jgi:hypothetical protein
MKKERGDSPEMSKVERAAARDVAATAFYRAEAET